MKPYFKNEWITLSNAEVMDGLKAQEDESVQCVVTSPPYWGLRDYGVAGQLGLEPTIDEYVEKLVTVFREVRRVLKSDGTLWLNIGDCYSGSGKGRLADGSHSVGGKQDTNIGANVGELTKATVEGLKPKDLVGMPWRVAFALQSDGWWLRSDIIWNKPNPMPESVTDRPTKAHEYIFLLTKSQDYYYDGDAIREPLTQASIERISQDIDGQAGSTRANGGTRSERPMKTVIKKTDKQRGHDRRHAGFNDLWDGMTKEEQQAVGANKRSVWTVATRPYKEAHFATFPEALITPCILAGSRPGDVIMDPFWGSGTTGAVAVKHQRKAVGIELSQDYCEMSLKRFQQGVLNFIGK